jgi:regulator of sigma E protease
VKVLRFSVGFGRVVARRQRTPDSTEFVICMLPLGGYVRMVDEREAAVDAADLARAFNRQSLWRRAAIVAAGPLANLALAVFLFAAAHWIGIEEPKAVLGAPPVGSLAEKAGLRAGDWVQSVSANGSDWTDVRSVSDLRWQVTEAAMERARVQLQVTDREGRAARTVWLDLTAVEPREVDAGFFKSAGLGSVFSEPVLGEIKAGGAAAQAGLRAGDLVLAVDGQAISDAQSLRDRIRAGVREGQPQAQLWRVERAGQTLEIVVMPAAVADGATTVGRIEAYVGKAPAMVTVRHGPIEGLVQGAVRTWELSSATVRMLGRMLIGEVSLKNLSGPLTIADYAGQSAQMGTAYFLSFLALVSVSLGVLNLLPLPMLDGGHLMYYIFEGVTGRPVSELWLARLQRGGIAMLLVMMSVALFNDVARLLGLH